MPRAAPAPHEPRFDIVARRERIVGQLAFMRQVFVRFLAFARQQGEMLRAFLAKDAARLKVAVEKIGKVADK